MGEFKNWKSLTYDHDDGNRLESVTDWDNQQHLYTYDDANRLTDFQRPNGVASHIDYDAAGRPIELTHQTATETLARYSHLLDSVGNRLAVTETLVVPLNIPGGAYLETDGLVSIEAENASQIISNSTHSWLTSTTQSDYSGLAYLQALPDVDILFQTNTLTDSPSANYPVYFTTPGAYAVWGRGNGTNAAGDSMYVGLDGKVVSVTGFGPGQWDWANQQTPSGDPATLSIEMSGVYTLTAPMREDGLRLDRLLLTTDTTYLPTGEGPAETVRQITATMTTTILTRTIVYTYDKLHRLTAADYSTSEAFEYAYDSMGNQTTITETLDSTIVTTYTYNAANQLITAKTSDDDLTWYYTHDNNGNLLRQTPGGTTAAEGETRYSYDAANRLFQVELYTGGSYTLLSEASYNGDGQRMSLTTYALGVGQTVSYVVGQNGELLVTDDGSDQTFYVYGQSLIAEFDTGWSYPLRDSNASVRQTVDENGSLTSAQTYRPFGGTLEEAGTYESIFGFTGAQLDRLSGLLYIGGRYYDPVTGRYLTPDRGLLNPYAPPQGPWWLLLPLVGIVFVWKGRRRGGPWRMVVLVLVIGVGLTLVSCGGEKPPPSDNEPKPPPEQPAPPEPPSEQPVPDTEPEQPEEPPSGGSTPPTPTLCPPTSELEITIHFHILDGTGPVNPKQHIDNTNALYEKHDVGVAVKQGTVIRDAYTEERTIDILGSEKWLNVVDDQGHDDPNSPEVVDLLNNNIGGGVNAYFVQALITGSLGKAYPDRGAFIFPTNPQNTGFTLTKQQPRTFYHELGHVIHGQHHEGDADNYMASGEAATGTDNMTPTQIEEIREFARNNP